VISERASSPKRAPLRDTRRKKSLRDPEEVARRDAFFRSIPEIISGYGSGGKNIVSVASVTAALATKGHSALVAKARAQAATLARARVSFRDADTAMEPHAAVGRVRDFKEKKPPGAPIAFESMLPPLPGLTEEVAKRIEDIRKLQAMCAVPTGPPPPPPTETAKRYSGVNPKMAEEQYFREHACARGVAGEVLKGVR
jgi:hypothetical protein